MQPLKFTISDQSEIGEIWRARKSYLINLDFTSKSEISGGYLVYKNKIVYFEVSFQRGVENLILLTGPGSEEKRNSLLCLHKAWK